MTLSIVRPMTANRRCTHLLRTRNRIEQWERSQEKRETQKISQWSMQSNHPCPKDHATTTTTITQDWAPFLFFFWPPRPVEKNTVQRPLAANLPIQSSPFVILFPFWDSTPSLMPEVHVHIHMDTGHRIQVLRSRKPYSSGAHVA